jgi:flagellar biosynthesis/type III secretory pathway protein FliH
MNIQRFGAALAGTVLIGAGGLFTAAAPAVAAPAQPTSITQSTPRPAFWEGYRDGRRDGFKAAREDCMAPTPMGLKGLAAQDKTDYMEGYEEGFDRGFYEGYETYC